MIGGLLSDSERLRRLQAVTDAALSSLELEELFATLLERTRAMLDVDTCAVLLVDRERNELVARAAVGLEEEVERGIRIPVGRGFAGRVAASRRPVILDDVDHADVLNPILREKGIKSMLGVPMVAGGEVIGVLHVGSLTPRKFTEEEAELLRLAAERAAVGVEHARLFEAERRGRQRIEDIQAVTDAALAHLDIDELLDVLLPRIRQILAADTCAVLLLDEGQDELVARAAVGLEEEVERGVRIPVGRGFAGRVAAGRRPVILDDVDHADVLNPILREKGIKSMLGVPLLAAGDVIGVLHVGTLVHRRFTGEDVELLALVAQRVALAVERGRLHAETLRLDELKSSFVATASHELREPASSVYGVLATLAARDELSEETRETVTKVGFEQAERLRKLIEQLLDLSQLDAQRVPMERRPVVLLLTLVDIVSAAVPQEAEVHLDVAPNLAAVLDPLVLDRVVSNLLVNAARYGSPPITVSAEARDRHLRIAVQDSGEGIPDELQPHLFERFSRGEGARGSGLGLTIARAYARAHGGDLVFVPGTDGARFELLLPRR
ncbi:MAG TPA: GAF domain-containing protein [Gaiellaceae bacterium]|jgi:signal transduction histidine kinase|nr:GAF domain-containing protein [Gaiellaceae bacterium]